MNYPKGFIIYDFMMKDLQLKGNQLLIYAFIYSCTIVGDGCYHSSISYLSKLLNINDSTTIDTLKKLTDSQLILKTELMTSNNVKVCEYRTNSTLLENPSGIGETHYNIYNNINNNINNNTNNNIELEKPSGCIKVDNEIEKLFNDYTSNDDLYNALLDFADYRKDKRNPLSVKAAKLLLGKLNKCKNDKDKIQCLQDSIMNGWTGVFPQEGKPSNKKYHDESDLEGTIRKRSGRK